MKSLFCYTLPLVLATSSLVAGPKPIFEKKSGSPETVDPKTSVEQRTEISRREHDSLSPGDGTDDASSLQQRNSGASASIAERKSSKDISALDTLQNPAQNHGMESTGTPTPSCFDAFIIEDYIPGGSSAKSKSANGRMAVVPSSTTHDTDRQRRLLEKNIAGVKTAHTALQQQTEQTANSPGFVVKSTIASLTRCVKPPSSKKLAANIAAVEKAQDDLNTIVTQFGAQDLNELFNEITEVPSTINIFDAEQGVREKAPMAQSFKFGMLIRKELQQLQQKTIADKLAGKVGDFGRSNPFGDMLTDLDRTEGRDNIRFSVIDGGITTLLNQKSGQANLATFRNFAGNNILEQVQPMEVAIASVMHQAGQSDFERIKFGEHRDSTAPNSLPFFTEGVNSKLWRPYRTDSTFGPILMKLFAGTTRKESQSYDLEKITPESGSPVFKLTATCSQSAANADFEHTLARDVVYQFEENHSFNSSHPISEENSPITIKCLEGKIVQSFEDKRTPEEFNHQAALYNLTAYQRRLDELGDPRQIETEYQNRIQFLASRAAYRPGAIMTQDRNAAEAKLQQLRKAQEDVETARQAVTHSQRRLDGISDDETDSQAGFEDDDN
ncbi:MAG: hypothetical protein K2W97_08910 [Chthoniobacterales bacterium]|nr:hypothetical protein [Chthoniobacterales bacterium]